MARATGCNDYFNLSAFSAFVTQSVYKYLLHQTSNLVTVFVFLILTDWASFLLALSQEEILDLADLLGLWHTQARRLSLFSTNAYQ
jgi:hypothetical protein